MRHGPDTARAPEQPAGGLPAPAGRGTRSRAMRALRRADLDAVFLDAGNTLITLDHALVCEVLAARWAWRPSTGALARAEAAARPAVSALRRRRRVERGTRHVHVLRRAASSPGSAGRRREADGSPRASSRR